MFTLKIEDTAALFKKQNKVNAEGENALSNVSYPQFVNYFKVLALRDKNVFSKAISTLCEVKGTAKQGKLV